MTSPHDPDGMGMTGRDLADEARARRELVRRRREELPTDLAALSLMAEQLPDSDDVVAYLLGVVRALVELELARPAVSR